MIVYPQINKIKVIVAPIIVACIILSIYSYRSYKSLQTFNNYLVEENDYVAKELFDMILEYHEIEVDNDSLKVQLENSRLKITSILDSVQNLEPNIKLLTNFKRQLNIIKSENKNIIKLVENLHDENEKLKFEADYYATALEKSNKKVSKFEISTSKLNSVNNSLIDKNQGLSQKIDLASKISPQITFVEAVKREKSDNSIVTTTSAKRTKKLNVAIKIQENKLATKGKRFYYLQVIDPNGNVVGDRGSVTIRNNETLINSKEISIDYNNEQIDLNYFIEQNQNEKFIKGVYHVGLYDSGGLVENSTFMLD